ncbi:hypothetical protein K7X08_024541 [Anisodus acutangulus]|uniref:Uncharacterized protein n=1 Tax=Anisodus acutangulus TaxID=402998 RepID=A0A9Q1M908_9SOLA|nr:hypothetical protein K7X08_024541 [Anisodus acutangulus]
MLSNAGEGVALDYVQEVHLDKGHTFGVNLCEKCSNRQLHQQGMRVNSVTSLLNLLTRVLQRRGQGSPELDKHFQLVEGYINKTSSGSRTQMQSWFLVSNNAALDLAMLSPMMELT